MFLFILRDRELGDNLLLFLPIFGPFQFWEDEARQPKVKTIFETPFFHPEMEQNDQFFHHQNFQILKLLGRSN